MLPHDDSTEGSVNLSQGFIIFGDELWLLHEGAPVRDDDGQQLVDVPHFVQRIYAAVVICHQIPRKTHHVSQILVRLGETHPHEELLHEETHIEFLHERPHEISEDHPAIDTPENASEVVKHLHPLLLLHCQLDNFDRAPNTTAVFVKGIVEAEGCDDAEEQCAPSHELQRHCPLAHRCETIEHLRVNCCFFEVLPAHVALDHNDGVIELLKDELDVSHTAHTQKLRQLLQTVQKETLVILPPLAQLDLIVKLVIDERR